MTEIRINKAWCKLPCSICISFCAPKVLAPDSEGHPEVINLEKCTECMLCELRCPNVAIEVFKASELEEEEVKING